MIERVSEVSVWDTFWKAGEFAVGANPVIIGAALKIFDGSVKGKKVLEVGCGRACDAIALKKLGAESFALDYSPVALGLAGGFAAENGINIFRLEAKAQELPFPDGAFDLVFSQGLIEHYQPPDRLLAEQIRVAEPGGYVLIDVPQLFSVQTVFKTALMKTNEWPFGWERNYTEEQLKRLMENFGLKIIDTYGYGYLPPVHTGILRVLRNFKRLVVKENQHQENPNGNGDSIYSVSGFQKSWLGRHTLNCVGLVGQKM